MKAKRLTSIWLLVIVCGLKATTACYATDPSVTSATAWLALIDARNYGVAYDRSNSFYKNVVTYDDFTYMMTTFREPMGALLSRTFSSVTYQSTLQGAPDGQYAVIQFTTAFASKASATEVVTMRYDASFGWTGYAYLLK